MYTHHFMKDVSTVTADDKNMCNKITRRNWDSFFSSWIKNDGTIFCTMNNWEPYMKVRTGTYY